ncbi:MAG: phosphoglycerate dehydrogenase [Lachnospiraceae bacterium]|nr:phosphoglycerate dehydrogenase [Lachnospiraceae bacterium]MBQ2040958.1 phosphoglycerate dehydrogenase [Lachnospiraceae bacterium]
MKNRKIYLLNNISDFGLKDFRSGYSITKDFNEAHGALVRSSELKDMEFPPALRAIARAGVGVNNIPLDKCAEHGIVVMNTPGANANGVKELVVAALMLASRDIVGGIEWVKEHADDPNIAADAEKAKKAFAGNEIIGKNIGVIGLGAIGVQVANICAYLGMTVYGYDPYISVGSAWRLKREIRHIESLEELFEKCDYITVHVPATPASRDMLNGLTFAKMKDGVKILNFSRDFVVNEDDIATALEEGKVAKYVTDFATPKSVRMKNTVVIPHLGASTEEAEDNCALMAVRQIQNYLDNGNIKNSCNYPDIDAGVCRTESRIACLHKNVPNMLGQLTKIMGEAQINIANMQNSSRDKYAYTLLDIETRISDDALEQIRAIPGMLRVRIVK